MSTLPNHVPPLPKHAYISQETETDTEGWNATEKDRKNPITTSTIATWYH